MTTIITDGDAYELDTAGRTADAVAAEVAAAVLEADPAQTFGLKVDGVVLRPGDTVTGGDIVELVEVTDYMWPEPPAAVALAETGNVVTEPEDAGTRRRGRATSEPDAEPAGD